MMFRFPRRAAGAGRATEPGQAVDGPATGIARAEYEERQEAVRRALRERGLRGALVAGRAFYDRPGPIAYLTGHFPPFPNSATEGPVRGLGHAFLALPADGPPILVADHYRPDAVAVDDVRVARDLVGEAAAALDERGLDRGFVALIGEDHLEAALLRLLREALPDVTFQPADEVVTRLRLIKSETEVRLLREAGRIAAVGLRAAVDVARPGASERDVCAAGSAAALRAGADFVRYLRVQTGPWSNRGSRWPQAMGRQLESGDLVWLDIIGARLGYQFDVLRTTVAGAPSQAQRNLLEACAETLAATLAAVRPGATVGEVRAAAQRKADELGYGDRLGAAVGHGIGLETMEPPYLMPGCEGVLQPGMALCVEPSFAVPGAGGCSIEEEVVVRPDGYELLTDFPRRLW